MLNTELADIFGRQMTAALGRHPTKDEMALAGALADLRRAEGVKLLRINAVVDRTGLGRSSIYALAAEGRFPRPIHVEGVRAAVWPSDSLDQWIKTQLEKAEG